MAHSLSQGDLRALVLELVAGREMTGYEAATALAGRGFTLAEGSVYPALRRLERDGLVSGHWVGIGPDVPRRRYYALTPAGERSRAEGRAHRRPIPGHQTARP